MIDSAAYYLLWLVLIRKERSIVLKEINSLRTIAHKWWRQSKLVDQQVNCASQDQSPGSSVYWCNLNWMPEEEVLTLALLAIVGNDLFRNDILRCELLLDLPSRIQRCESLTTMEKAVLLRLIEDRLKRHLPFYQNRQRTLLQYFKYRRIKGLFSDSVLLRRISRRLRPRVKRPGGARTLPAGTPLQTSRHRGYRDHGSARPSHKWLPTSDWRLTREQWTREQLQELNLQFFTLFLTNPFNLCFKQRE